MENRKEDILPTKYFKIRNISNLRDLLYSSAKLFKGKTAFKLKDSSGKIYNIKYMDFKNDVEALGTSLIKRGFESKTITLIGKNSYNWIMSYLAASIIGVVSPLDKELHVDDIINFINVSQSSVVIGDSQYLQAFIDNKEKLEKEIVFICFENIESSGNMISFKDLIKEGYELVNKGNTSFSSININSYDMHILLFTSGTTGNAKGICLSHKNICSNIMSVCQVVKINTSTTVLSILPLHHTYECTLGNLVPLYSGGTITYCDGLKYISKNINEYKPSFIVCVPLLLKNVYGKIIKELKKKLPAKYFCENKHCIDCMPRILRFFVKRKIRKSLGGKIKRFIVGAAAIDPMYIESFYKFGIKVLQGYGLTECSPLVAGNNDIFFKSDAVRFTYSKCRI